MVFASYRPPTEKQWQSQQGRLDRERTTPRRPEPSERLSLISHPVLVSSSRAGWHSIPAGPHAVHPDTVLTPAEARPQRPKLFQSFSSRSGKSEATIGKKSPKASKRESGIPERSLPSVLFGSSWLQNNSKPVRPSTRPPPPATGSSGSDHALLEDRRRYRESSACQQQEVENM